MEGKASKQMILKKVQIPLSSLHKEWSFFDKFWVTIQMKTTLKKKITTDSAVKIDMEAFFKKNWLWGRVVTWHVR